MEEEENLNLVSLLLFARDKDKEGMKEEDIIGECISMFLAGFDTTSRAAGTVLMLLGNDLKAQDKAREEINKLMNKVEGYPNFGELKDELEYMWGVIKETLRLWPVVSGLAREVKEEYEYEDEKGKGKKL